ncbi:zinc ribbon domain-containing protein [Synechococcus elongatus IITB7]|uniref:zinc ribbon domain-containing protein n=1 Tax=Synechococcus elongatus TaxID=32046 RepID=UPI0030D390BB
MWSRLRQWFSSAFRKSRTINNEPLNKVSLVVIIIIDIFILSNVFSGLAEVSRWPLTASESYPCYQDWQIYQDPQLRQEKNQGFVLVSSAVKVGMETIDGSSPQLLLTEQYKQLQSDRLGEVAPLCWQYAERYDKISKANYSNLLTSIDERRVGISRLEDQNRKIREQYDSSLLEEIAGQAPDQAITDVSAAQARQALEANQAKIQTLRREISDFENRLLTQPTSQSFLSFLADQSRFQAVLQGYQQAGFWYPALQLLLQILFLAPLLAIAGGIHRYAQQRGYGLLALLSWHLLVIFSLPLIFKAFELLRINLIFDALSQVVQLLFGRLLFLVNYLYIFLIPAIGFGIIKIAQVWIFNPRLQAANRVQKSRCIKCAKRLPNQEAHCPHCGHYQYVECSHCHQLTYQYLPYCRACGSAQRSR